MAAMTETYTPLTDAELRYTESAHKDCPEDCAVRRAAAEIRALRAREARLLAALKRTDEMMENLWKAVPWGKTFNLDIGTLNDAEMERKQLLAETAAASIQGGV